MTLGIAESVLGDFSNEGADLEKRLCPDSSKIFGRTLVEPTGVLGPHVFPLTPSAGTAKYIIYYVISIEIALFRLTIILNVSNFGFPTESCYLQAMARSRVIEGEEG